MKSMMIPLVGLMMLGAFVPQAAASTTTCTTAAPIASICQAEVYFPHGAGVFTLDVELLQSYTGVTVEFFPRLNPTNDPTPIYSATPSFTCTTTNATGCNTDPAFPLAGTPGQGYLLRATLAGSPMGVWGWSWFNPEPIYT